MANYYGNRGNGSSLRHYRTKGSRNGYSKNPKYKVVGQKAEGRLVNGRYVYDTPGGTKSGSRRPLTDYQQMARNDYLAQPGKKNNWQQQANYASAMGTAANNFNSGRISGYDERDSVHRKHTDADGNLITSHLMFPTPSDHSGNSHDRISTLPTGNYSVNDLPAGETVAEWDSRSKNKGKTKNVDDHFTQVGHQAAQSIMNGQRNNWQQQANAHRAINEVGQKTATGQISGFTGWHNSSLNAPGILDDAAKRHAGVANGVIGYDHSYANAVAKNNKNTPEYKAAMRKKVQELSAQGAKRNDGVADFQKRMALQEQAERERGRYRPLASPNYEQQEYARKQKTLKGRLDLAKRAANVAMVNAKKKIQKKFSKDDAQTKGGPKTKAMTTGTTLYSNGPGGPITYSYSPGHGYTPSANGGLIGHLTANMLNTHAPTSNVHAVGGQNQQHNGNAKRQTEAMVKRKSGMGSKNDWQKQAASAQANAMAANRVNSGQSQAANVQENKKGFLGILKDKRKTYQMSNKTNKIIGDYVSKKKTESKLTAAEQRRKDEKKAKKIIKKGKKKLNKLLSYMNKETK